MSSPLPSQQRALVLDDIGIDCSVKQVPVPPVVHGSVTVQILAAVVLSYHGDIYNGRRKYALPTPIVPGASAIGRVAAAGPDAVALKEGQLVYIDCVVRGRDDPSALFLSAIHEGGSEGSKKLMRDVWRNGTFAEYASVPLENCIVLDEARLCGELGYSIQDLAYIGHLIVPYGGLRDIRLEPGETVIVCPATGGYGGAGVQVALAMGARVIAMGRNEKELARLEARAGTPTVKLSGDQEADTAALRAFGLVDAVLDLTPPMAADSPHPKSTLAALRHGGRYSAMGFTNQPIVSWDFVGKNITLKGKLMYEREDMVRFVKLLERGAFPRGKDFVEARAFTLEQWKEAFEVAAEHAGCGKVVVLTP